jgi:replication factor C subunit 1
MFAIKYRPNKLDNFIGNRETIILPFIQWLLDWSPENKKTKCALISGKNGSGKSLLVELMLKKHSCNMIHIAPDEDRTKDYFTSTIKPLLKTKTAFNGNQNVLVFSDIDVASDHGFIGNLVECIKESFIPIICICDNRYSQNIKPILNYVYDIKIPLPKFDDLYPLLYKIVTTEGIKIGKSGLQRLYDSSVGDIRYLLNTLELNLKKTDTTKNIQSANIFETTGLIMSQETTLDDKVAAYWMAPDIHMLMIQENYIGSTLPCQQNVMKQLTNIAYSADSLSDADLFDATFLNELTPHVVFNSVKSTSKCTKKGFGQIKFPQILGKITTINKNRREQMDYEKATFSSITKEKVTKKETVTKKEIVTKKLPVTKKEKVTKKK